ncbi:MAG: nitroreductase [Chloroflexota bacterium]|nr:MAG: nitroreductase [Chloroflexota bacterium]
MTDLIDAMYTNRSIRRFHPDPVPDHVVAKLIEAATRAPNGRNAQPWRFIVVRDPEMRQRVGEVYREAWDHYSPPSRLAAVTDPRERKRVEGAYHLGATMGTEPPLLIVVCSECEPAAGSDGRHGSGATVFPAIQNLLLAARAYGLGGCMTTIHRFREEKLKEVLGIPENIDTYAIVPLGRPAEKFGPLRRRPVSEVAYADRWGAPLATE